MLSINEWIDVLLPKIWTMVIIYISVACVGTLLTALFVDTLPEEIYPKKRVATKEVNPKRTVQLMLLSV